MALKDSIIIIKYKNNILDLHEIDLNTNFYNMISRLAF